jgi:hypothetical protein
VATRLGEEPGGIVQLVVGIELPAARLGVKSRGGVDVLGGELLVFDVTRQVLLLRRHVAEADGLSMCLLTML